MILAGKVSNNRAVEKSNCTVEERHPVSFLVAAGLDHSVAEIAPQNGHSFMGGWEVLSIPTYLLYLISLFSLLWSFALMPVPQCNPAKKGGLAPTD